MGVKVVDENPGVVVAVDSKRFVVYFGEKSMADRFPATGCVKQLLERVPELQPAYEEHLRDYDEVLPHVFFGEVTRYVVVRVRAGEIGVSSPVGRILDFLERCAASGDEQVEELVWVSFLENLVEYDDVLLALRGLIGPNLAKGLKAYGK